MNPPSSRKQVTHERIVETAARAIRRGGFNGVGVADIMKEAGLTHGGFYAHFRSRDALLCEALEQAGRESAARIAQGRAAGRPAPGHSPFQGLLDVYLSPRHLSATETGCPVAALASEMPRQTAEVRQVAAKRVRALIATIRATLPPDAAPEAAGMIAGQLVGALQLARALGENAESKALLAATRGALLAQFESPDRTEQ